MTGKRGPKDRIDWQDEAVLGRLRTMVVEEGRTAAQIAAVLSAELGIDVSRNAVIGGVSRHLGGEAKLARKTPGPGKVARLRAARQPRHVPKVTPAASDKSKAIERRLVARSGLDEPEPMMLQIESLKDHNCRWPIGDPHKPETFGFCGHRVFESRIGALPYCEAHARKAVSRTGRAGDWTDGGEAAP